MARIAATLLAIVFVTGCARTPAPADTASTPPSPGTEATPAKPPEYTVADAPASAPKINGDPCMPEMETGTPPQFLPDSPVGVVARFYELHSAHVGAGAPDAGRLATYAPLLTRDLVAALTRAGAERDRAMAAEPGEKPPFVEGELFGSLFEGYTRVQPLTVATEGDHARVPVCLAYADASGRTEWTDTVVLRKEDGAWRIDDVVYGGQWDFANSGTLRDALPKAP
jgi:hypothetical protein